MDHLIHGWALARRLKDLGYLKGGCCGSETELAQAVYRYQELHSLKCDGWCGPRTRDSLLAPRFCGHPDVLHEQASVCKWPKKRITWTINGQLPMFDFVQLHQAFRDAWKCWSDVCDIEPAFVEAREQPADITINFGAIDGGFGTLAWSELPCGGAGRLKQLYDNSEVWVINEQMTGRQVDLVRVACHEIGHALGLDHLGAGNLMAPTISPAIRKPQAGDVAEVQRRYGPPKGTTPPAPPAPPAAEEWVIRFPRPVDKIVIKVAA